MTPEIEIRQLFELGDFGDSETIERARSLEKQPPKKKVVVAVMREADVRQVNAQARQANVPTVGIGRVDQAPATIGSEVRAHDRPFDR